MLQADAGAVACGMLRRADGAATVLAVFTHVTYLRVHGQGICALTDRTVPRGPLHVRVGELPPSAVGEQVGIDGAGVLTVGRCRITAPAPGWVGAQPGRAELPRAASLALHLETPTALATCLGTAELTGPIEGAVASGELLELVRLIGGRGPGLTPAGDDLLAGVLLVAWLAAGPALRNALPSVASASQTNDITAAFLGAAALGQCIEPAHELVRELIRGDLPQARRAHVSLGGFGASSGYALAEGIFLALRLLPELRGSES